MLRRVSAEPDAQKRTLRAAFFVGMGLTLLGSCGASNGLGGLTAESIPDTVEVDQGDAALTEATEEVSEALREKEGAVRVILGADVGRNIRAAEPARGEARTGVGKPVGLP